MLVDILSVFIKEGIIYTVFVTDSVPTITVCLPT